MSRQHAYAYVIDRPTAEQLQMWETVVDDHVAHGLYPEAVCNGGGSGPEQLDVWLYCNRTKIGVYRQRLDAVFSAEGRIVDLRQEHTG